MNQTAAVASSAATSKKPSPWLTGRAILLARQRVLIKAALKVTLLDLWGEALLEGPKSYRHWEHRLKKLCDQRWVADACQLLQESGARTTTGEAFSLSGIAQVKEALENSSWYIEPTLVAVLRDVDQAARDLAAGKVQ